MELLILIAYLFLSISSWWNVNFMKPEAFSYPGPYPKTMWQNSICHIVAAQQTV